MSAPRRRAAYLEFNLAPDGQWAAYRFSGYRAGMAPLTGIRPPRIELRTQSDRLLLSAEVELPADLAAADAAAWACRRSWKTPRDNWTTGRCAMPAPEPDFHHPDSFGFEI